MSHPDPVGRRQIASMGGTAKAANHNGDPRELTAHAKRAADERWLTLARADLPADATEHQVIWKAERLRALHMKRMAKSAETRRKRKGAFLTEPRGGAE